MTEKYYDRRCRWSWFSACSKLLGHVLLSQNYDVKVSEVHGMSQRGGSVVTYVRYGDKVYSPIIDKGQADVIISFEKLEAARYMNYLKKGGKIVVSDQEIDPMPVITGAAEYPENLIEKMKAAGADIDDMDALSLAMEAGSSKSGKCSCLWDEYHVTSRRSARKLGWRLWKRVYRRSSWR